LPILNVAITKSVGMNRTLLRTRKNLVEAGAIIAKVLSSLQDTGAEVDSLALSLDQMKDQLSAACSTTQHLATDLNARDGLFAIPVIENYAINATKSYLAVGSEDISGLWVDRIRAEAIVLYTPVPLGSTRATGFVLHGASTFRDYRAICQDIRFGHLTATIIADANLRLRLQRARYAEAGTYDGAFTQHTLSILVNNALANTNGASLTTHTWRTPGTTYILDVIPVPLLRVRLEQAREQIRMLDEMAGPLDDNDLYGFDDEDGDQTIVLPLVEDEASDN